MTGRERGGTNHQKQGQSGSLIDAMTTQTANALVFGDLVWSEAPLHTGPGQTHLLSQTCCMGARDGARVGGGGGRGGKHDWCTSPSTEVSSVHVGAPPMSTLHDSFTHLRAEPKRCSSLMPCPKSLRTASRMRFHMSCKHEVGSIPASSCSAEHKSSRQGQPRGLTSQLAGNAIEQGAQQVYPYLLFRGGHHGVVHGLDVQVQLLDVRLQLWGPACTAC